MTDIVERLRVRSTEHAMNKDYYSGKDLTLCWEAADRIEELEKALEYHVAQLRHAYAQLAAGMVKDQKQFADGLIAPVLRALEERK